MDSARPNPNATPRRGPAREPALEIERLRAALARMDAVLALDPTRSGRVATGISGWSAEQHLAHVALANELSLRNVKSLFARKGVLIRHDREPTEEGMRILASGELPRGVAQAPRMVTPPAVIDRDLLLEWVADNRRDVDELAQCVGELGDAPGLIQHQLLGPLNAVDWLRFAAVHTAHHLAIVDEVLAAPA